MRFWLRVQATATITNTAPSVGSNSERDALRKLSNRKPISRMVSTRSRCETSISASASAIGTARIDLLEPTKASTTRSEERRVGKERGSRTPGDERKCDTEQVPGLGQPRT